MTGSLSPVAGIIGRKISLRRHLWERQGAQCRWCQKVCQLVGFPTPDQATIDHVVPRSRGGTDDLSNLVIACYECNHRRGYENQHNLPEGSLIGKYKMNRDLSVTKEVMKKRYVTLTGDDKKAILNGHPLPVLKGSVPRRTVEDVLREQRDQAQKEIEILRKELRHYTATVVSQAEEIKRLESMPVFTLIRKRLAAWLLKFGD